jgi:putative transposase
VLWAADVTQIRTGEGWLHLARGARSVVPAGRGLGHGQRGHRRTGQRRTAHGLPTPTARPARGAPLRPRRGQYLSIRYTERLAEQGAVTSVGARGDSYDNALAETVNGLYKAELIYRQGPWKTVEHVELATAAWVNWWNTQRLHSTCGNVPPAE